MTTKQQRLSNCGKLYDTTKSNLPCGHSDSATDATSMESTVRLQWDEKLPKELSKQWEGLIEQTQETEVLNNP